MIVANYSKLAQWLCPYSRTELGDFHVQEYRLDYEQVPQSIRSDISRQIRTLANEWLGKPITPELLAYAQRALEKWADGWNKIEATQGLQIGMVCVREKYNSMDIDMEFLRTGVKYEALEWFNQNYAEAEHLVWQMKNYPLRYSDNAAILKDDNYIT